MTDLNAFLPYVNGPLGFLFRRALWIPDRRHRIVKITPNAHHLHLGGREYRATLYSSNQHIEAAYKNLNWFMRSLHNWDMATNKLTPALNLGFDSWTPQPDETSAKDTFISANNSTSNYGTDAALVIGEGNNGTGYIKRTLIDFDIDGSFSYPIYITAATLSLWLFSDLASQGDDYRVYRQKRNWVETQATWEIYSTGNNWQTAGGFGSNDCEQTDIGYRTMAISESNGEKQWTLTAQALQDVNDGTWTDYGWLIKSENEDNDGYQFRSSSYTTASERPKLSVTYYPQDSGGLLL